MPSHTVLVDSRDRDFSAHPTPSRYKIRLPRSYYNVKSARLVSAEIPRSFYTFSAALGNTSFEMILPSGTVAITIPDGNYTFTSMKTTLEGALAASTGLTWTVLFSATTNRVTMFNVELVDFTIVCPAQEVPTDWGLLYYLGFEADTSPASSSGKIASPRPATFNNVAYILLDIDDLYGMDEGATYGGVVGRRPFAKIPIDPGSEGYAMLDTSKCLFDDVAQRPVIPRLDSLRIRFRFHDNRDVDFNMVDHSFAIRLETVDREPAGGANVVVAKRRPLPPPAAAPNKQVSKKQSPAAVEIANPQKRPRWVIPAALAAVLVSIGLYFAFVARPRS